MYKSNALQTTLGHELCSSKNNSKVYYVVFNKFSSSPKLTKFLKKTSYNDERLATFSRKEFLDHIGVDEDEDTMVVLKNIMLSPKLEPKSAVFLDEVPLERHRSKNRYDWA